MGNRTSATLSGVATSGSFNAADELTAQGTTTYSYDANGTLTGTTDPSGTTTSYTVNAQDELTGVQTSPGSGTQTSPGAQTPTTGTPTGASVQFGYDAFGRMVSRTDGGGNTAYFYDGGTVLLAHPTHGTTFLASEYLPGAGGQIAAINRLNGSGKPLPVESYYQRDGQGSVVGLTNNSGSNGPVVPTARGYDAWGTPAGLVDSDDTYGLPLAYTGLPYDQEAAGLTQAHARWYDASQGRMLSRDPLGGSLAAPASQNRYTYAQDNPTTLMDPSGLGTISGAGGGGSLSGVGGGGGKVASLALVNVPQANAAQSQAADSGPGVGRVLFGVMVALFATIITAFSALLNIGPIGVFLFVAALAGVIAAAGLWAFQKQSDASQFRGPVAAIGAFGLLGLTFAALAMAVAQVTINSVVTSLLAALLLTPGDITMAVVGTIGPLGMLAIMFAGLAVGAMAFALTYWALSALPIS